MQCKSGARTRAHSQRFRKTETYALGILHEVLWECDASPHRFPSVVLGQTRRTLTDGFGVGDRNHGRILVSASPQASQYTPRAQFNREIAAKLDQPLHTVQ